MSPYLTRLGRIFILTAILGMFLAVIVGFRGRPVLASLLFSACVILFVGLIVGYIQACLLTRQLQRGAISIAPKRDGLAFYPRHISRFSFVVSNHSPFRVMACLRPCTSMSVSVSPVQNIFLEPEKSVTVSFELCPAWCGKFAIHGFNSNIQTFNGCFDVSCFNRCHVDLDVAPASFAGRTSLWRDEEDEAQRSSPALGPETFQLRQYIPGDTPARIAWKASAHRGQLISRESPAPNEKDIYYILDARSIMRVAYDLLQKSDNRRSWEAPGAENSENDEKDEQSLKPFPVHDALEDAIAMVWTYAQQHIQRRQSLVSPGFDIQCHQQRGGRFKNSLRSALMSLRMPRDAQHIPQDLEGWVKSIADHIRMTRRLEFQPAHEIQKLSDLNDLSLTRWCYTHLNSSAQANVRTPAEILSVWCAQERLDLPYRESINAQVSVLNSLQELARIRRPSQFVVCSTAFYNSSDFEKIQALLNKNHHTLTIFDFSVPRRQSRLNGVMEKRYKTRLGRNVRLNRVYSSLTNKSRNNSTEIN